MIWTTRPASDQTGGVAAKVAGKGPTVVLIHGVGLRGEAWQTAGEALARDFEVHAVDMPGHGRSPLCGAATLADFAASIAEYVRALSAPVRLAGHSMGAMVALDIAGRGGTKVSHVAAINAIYRRDEIAAVAVRKRAANLSASRVSDPEGTLSRWFGSAPQGALARAAEDCRRWLTQADPAGYKAAYSVFATEDGPSDAALRDMSAAALFLTGALDPNSTPEMSAAMSKICRAGSVCVFEDAAHMLPLTHAEQTARTLKAFFLNEGDAHD